MRWFRLTQMHMADFAHWSKSLQKRIEITLGAILPESQRAPERLHAAMRYATLGGGKRVRPMLVFAAAETGDAIPDLVKAAACAVELIHVYSLVHDDLPAMDNDDLRRGRPTCHREFDEATALLVGDALQSLAFDLISRPGLHPDPARQLDMVHLLAHASGSRGMAGGQAVDLASTGKHLELAELEFMHLHKTGALIRAATLLGGLASHDFTPERRTALERYAHAIGLAFQVMDDVLDAETDSATLGKTAGKDAAQGKATYLTLMRPREARAYAGELIETALEAISGFGPGGKHLADIARFIVSRAY